MLIGHFSDLHSELSVLIENTVEPHVWICTGDMMPNKTRGYREIEPRFQTDWFMSHREQIEGALRGIPLIWVSGNHDYVDLAELLRRYSGLKTWSIDPSTVIEYKGVRFAGFPGIPYIAGEWNHEIHQHDFVQLVNQALDHRPDVLLTHAPPDGILSGPAYIPGIKALTHQLMYREDARPKAHLFGHIHEHGGMSARLGPANTLFVNSSCNLQFVRVTHTEARIETHENHNARADA